MTRQCLGGGEGGPGPWGSGRGACRLTRQRNLTGALGPEPPGSPAPAGRRGSCRPGPPTCAVLFRAFSRASRSSRSRRRALSTSLRSPSMLFTFSPSPRDMKRERWPWSHERGQRQPRPTLLPTATFSISGLDQAPRRLKFYAVYITNPGDRPPWAWGPTSCLPVACPSTSKHPEHQGRAHLA